MNVTFAYCIVWTLCSDPVSRNAPPKKNLTRVVHSGKFSALPFCCTKVDWLNMMLKRSDRTLFLVHSFICFFIHSNGKSASVLLNQIQKWSFNLIASLWIQFCWSSTLLEMCRLCSSDLTLANVTQIVFRKVFMWHLAARVTAVKSRFIFFRLFVFVFSGSGSSFPVSWQR